MSIPNSRQADFPVDPQFVARWSPRAFSGEPIAEGTLLTFLEAARWAPSAFNSQPWRFLYARRGTSDWDLYLGLVNDFNRAWAQSASAIVFILSQTRFTPPGKTEDQDLATHAFDAGAAWAHLALQASLSGWSTHGIAGIERDKIRATLDVPPAYAIQAGVVIGKPGDIAQLSESLRQRETPSPRQPLSALAFAGKFRG
ncbi:nitroreductase family protein [Pigmentiphaga litoralis]|uniref:Nitroreductase n=1 Tax=Pigmentiphaga litoralis TaxID=516702 RepID=A0A7Y9IYI1_9BURK|nr:nitroreductase family protein [Pigmentiphaga litoralis]NYE26346.1 nitroreductase [Pigmentiphaga litoralis]NYE85466.1 nitroreductase [Pigmentiphaga litoralis]